jgi:hypothetical protein
MHRMAGFNKTLAANYNAERVHDECVTRFDAQTNGGIP